MGRSFWSWLLCPILGFLFLEHNICSTLEAVRKYSDGLSTEDVEYSQSTEEIFKQEGASTSAPTWLKRPLAQVNVSEDNIAELHCNAQGEPPPLVQWSFNDIPLHDLSHNERRLLLDGGRVLRIQDLNHDIDSGLYQCNASNFLGHITAATYLNVQAFAPRFTMGSHRVWKVIRKSTVDLNCDVEAAPKALIRWVDANDSLISLVPGKVQLFETNYTLRIYDVNSADEGFYYCNVSNKYGINRALNKIEVYNPTYFIQIPSPRQIFLDAFDSFELKCEVRADTRLSINYDWLHNGRPANLSALKAEKLLDENGVSHLVFRKARGRASGTFECRATTDVDEKKSSVEVLVRDVPEQPKILKIDCSYFSHQQALISWRAAEGINPSAEAISHFSVEMATQHRRTDSVKVDTETIDWKVAYEERELKNRDTFKLLLPLSPWVNYTFRVVAHNFYGASKPVVSQPNICSTAPDVPHKSPENVQVFGTEPDNMVIRWKPMDKMEWNAPELRYLIRYRLTKADPKLDMLSSKMESGGKQDENSGKWHEFFVEDPLVNETIIRDQPTFQQYEVQVRAVNSMGYSAVSPKTAVGYSGEDFPRMAPKNLRVIGFHNHSSVILGWDAVPEDTVRGHFKGYKIVYWETKEPYFVNFVTVNNDTLRAQIDLLEAIRNYTVKIHVINGQYQSQSSNLVHFQTPEGAPSKVHNLRARAVGSKSIFVTWEPPLHTNGHIRGYFVTFENSTSGFIEETYVLHRQLYYLHEFLVPDSPYRVAVWAETNGGEGPKVIRAIRTWPVRDPDPPSFTIRSSSPTSLNVQWHPMANHTMRRMSGTTFQVKYRKRSSSRWQFTEPISLPHTELELVNMDENTEYVFAGIAQEGIHRKTESEPVNFKTDSHKKLSYIDPERLRNAAWFIAVLASLAIALLLIAGMCYIAHRRHRTGLYSLKSPMSSTHRYSSVRSGGSSTTDTTATSDFLDDRGEEHKRFIRRFQDKQKMFSAAGRRMISRNRAANKKAMANVITEDVREAEKWIQPPENVLLQLPKK
ncbi:fibronectin type III domain-containing protein [Ditylenchus destructor]|nr:fibronectin type III domain-containing protein [Ditylenchus destructor]